MLETLAAETSTLQNVYAPLPFSVHFVFCLIATLLYTTQFMRKGSVHYLIIMAAIDLTIVTQFCTESIVVTFLFAVEVLLLVLAGVFSHKYNKAQAAKSADNAQSAKNNAAKEPDSENNADSSK